MAGLKIRVILTTVSMYINMAVTLCVVIAVSSSWRSIVPLRSRTSEPSNHCGRGELGYL